MELTADAMPEGAVADYLLEPAEVPEEKGMGPDNEKADGAGKEKKAGHRSTLVIFAVDVSGSMSSTTEVPALQGKGAESHCNHRPREHMMSLTILNVASRCSCYTSLSDVATNLIVSYMSSFSQLSGAQQLGAVEGAGDHATSHAWRPSRKPSAGTWSTWLSLSLRIRWVGLSNTWYCMHLLAFCGKRMVSNRVQL